MTTMQSIFNNSAASALDRGQMMALPKPYYQDEDYGIVIYNADCREILPHLPKVDLVLTDPPYGINAHILQPPSDSYRKRTGRSPSKRLNAGGGKLKDRLLNKSNCDWDCSPPNKETFDVLFSHSHNQIIWGGNYFPLPPTRGILAWDKQQPWENFSQFELGWTNYDSPARIFRFNKSFIENKLHPTQKPEGLMIWCLSIACDAQTILDPFMGSGTTLVAAKQLGRKAIGIEIEERYCEIAVKRLAQDVFKFE